MELEQAKKEIEKLSKELKEYSFKYYNSGTSSIRDEEYDQKEQKLKKLEELFPQLKLPDSPTIKINDGLKSDFKKIKHKSPMLSLSNIYSQKELESWYDSIIKKLPSLKPKIYCDLKIDGMAISLLYIEGKLQKAISRGDGETGEDLTKNVNYITSLPKKINYLLPFEIRGEIFFPKDKFEEFNQKQLKNNNKVYKNTRNSTVGIIRMKDTDISDRGLEILIYDMLEGSFSHNHSENMQKLRELGFLVNNQYCCSNDLKEIWSFYQTIEQKRETFPFDIDGVVCKVNQTSFRNILRADFKKPKWAIAYKFKSGQVKSKLLEIKDSVGRTGVITPVAILEAVQLLNTQVQKASLYNYQHINNLDIRIGDIVIIEKGGDIIPKIVGVDISQRKYFKPVIPPTNCPACNQLLKQSVTQVDIYCTNSSCSGIIQGNLEHFISKKGMNIEFLGKSTLKLFIENNLIATIPDIYELYTKKMEVAKLEGFGKKSIKNLFTSINESKKKELNKLIYSLGIPHIGEISAKQIAGLSKNIDGLIHIKREDLEKLENFGEIVIESALDWLSSNKSLLKELKKIGLASKNYQAVNQSLGTVVITGTLTLAREVFLEKLEKVGFKISNLITPKTTILIIGKGYENTTKFKKAQKLSIQILSEEQFQEQFSL